MANPNPQPQPRLTPNDSMKKLPVEEVARAQELQRPSTAFMASV